MDVPPAGFDRGALCVAGWALGADRHGGPAGPARRKATCTIATDDTGKVAPGMATSWSRRARCPERVLSPERTLAAVPASRCRSLVPYGRTMRQ
jgi:hypothetical protein